MTTNSRNPESWHSWTTFENKVNGGISNAGVRTKSLPDPPQSIPPSTPKMKQATKYRHFAAAHYEPKNSCLSHDSKSSPSFLGFRNLMVLVLIVMNMRLVVENFMKYGVLICIRCHDYRRQDLILGALLVALVPGHLSVAYIIELVAAQHAKGVIGRSKREEADFQEYYQAHASKDSKFDYQEAQASKALHLHYQKDQAIKAFQSTWRNIAWAHGINASLCLLITSVTVYKYVHHPLIGTICEVNAIIAWLKICSYAFTNRDLRHNLLSPNPEVSLPPIYSHCPYPRNITLGNLSYFWWAPTLVYQPVYPRSTEIRWVFVAKRLAETVGLSIFIWLASAQYAAPVLRNSLKSPTWEPAFIIERLMKLSTISLIIWLAGFFAVFQSMLNALAEVTRFADREFYGEWWNSPGVGAYWRTWNMPVHHFMIRHIYFPMVGRGWSPRWAGTTVFVLSGFLHELAVGVPTHNILGVAFIGMVVQIPLTKVTLRLEKMQDPNSKILGNCIFWISFCLVGQPLAVLLYFFAWQAKYGSVSRNQSVSI